MNEDERLTEEELRIMCDNDKLFDEYDLKNMYSVCDEYGEGRKCPDCGLKHIDENKHLFYTYKYTRCMKCSRIYTKQYARKHREKLRIYSKRYRDKLKELDNYGVLTA